MSPTIPAPTIVPPVSAPAERLQRLFRAAQRSGRVHPLQHLLQRYRTGERA